VDRETWEKVQKRLSEQTARDGDGTPKIRAAANVLAGKLFDEQGEPLYSTGAKGRHGGRYRYYVSRELVRGGGSSLNAEKRWRLAAPELEQSVVVSAQRILDDQAAIATTLQEAGGLSSAEIQSLLKTAEAKRVSLGSRSQAASTIAELVERVDLRKNGIEITMNLESLLPRDSRICRASTMTFTRFAPLQMKRRGVAMRLVIGGVSTCRTDPTLLKAIARGHKWFNELVSGRAMFTREIAEREGVNERFVRRLIPLAFLSPAIVQMIAEGRQRPDLTGEALSRGIDVPIDWVKQHAALGFD
jgi:site-specific DNA recombinase